MAESPTMGFIEMGFVTSGLNNDGTIAKGLPNSSQSLAGSGRGCGSPPKLESLTLAAVGEEELLFLLRSLKQNVLNEGPCKGPGSEEDSMASVQLETSVRPRAESCSSSSSRWAKSLADPAVLKRVDLESDGRDWSSGLEHERLEVRDHLADLASFLRAKNFMLIDGEWKKLEVVEEEELDVVELRISSRDWVLPASFHEAKLCGDPGA